MVNAGEFVIFEFGGREFFDRGAPLAPGIGKRVTFEKAVKDQGNIPEGVFNAASAMPIQEDSLTEGVYQNQSWTTQDDYNVGGYVVVRVKGNPGDSVVEDMAKELLDREYKKLPEHAGTAVNSPVTSSLRGTRRLPTEKARTRRVADRGVSGSIQIG